MTSQMRKTSPKENLVLGGASAILWLLDHILQRADVCEWASTREKTERSCEKNKTITVIFGSFLPRQLLLAKLLRPKCFIAQRLPRVLGLLYNETEQNRAQQASWEQNNTSGPIKISRWNLL